MYIPNYILLISFTSLAFTSWIVYFLIVRKKHYHGIVFFYTPLIFISIYFVTDKIFYFDFYVAAIPQEIKCFKNGVYNETLMKLKHKTLIVVNPQFKYKSNPNPFIEDVFQWEINSLILGGAVNFEHIYFKIDVDNSNFLWRNGKKVSTGLYELTNNEVKNVVNVIASCSTKTIDSVCDNEKNKLLNIKKNSLFIQNSGNTYSNNGKWYGDFTRQLTDNNGRIYFKYYEGTMSGAWIERLDKTLQQYGYQYPRRRFSCESDFKSNQYLLNFRN